jgi:RNA polymerase sigma factor (sigma-70 family)
MRGVSNIRHELEGVFRRQRPSLLAAMTRALGPRNLDIIEAALQDAFVTAAEEWPATGAPDRPDAWILTAARNRALDYLRRSRTSRVKADDLREQAELVRADDAGTSARLKGEIEDDDLQMIFVACHPCNSLESQIALTLRTLCGMDIDEIARALLSDSQAVAKRLVRARQALREAGVELAFPPASEVEGRLASVTKVLYLLFNEGYSSLKGPRQIREELCREAIRLGEVLARHPATALPSVHALVALMLLQSSRLTARTDDAGALLTLEEQDRTAWDLDRITRGLHYLKASATGSELSEYHLEAAIAACHATAASFEETDWPRILASYDLLLAANDSPVIAFNRAVAVGFSRGPEEGLRELRRLRDAPALAAYFPYLAALGEFARRAGDLAYARASLTRALVAAGTDAEREFVSRRIAGLGAHPSA